MARQTDEQGRILDIETQTIPTRQGKKTGGHRESEQHQLNVNADVESPVKWNPNRD